MNLLCNAVGHLIFHQCIYAVYVIYSNCPICGLWLSFHFSYSLLSYVFQYWRQVYLVMVLAMTLAEFFAQIHPLYLTTKWQKFRSVILCSVVAYGLIPTIHWIWLSGGFSSEVVQVHINSSSGANIF